MNRTLWIACIAIAASGCVTGVDGEFPYLTTQKIGDNIQAPRRDGLRTVEGKSWSFELIGFPIVPFLRSPSLGDAVDDALAKGDGDLMLDAVVERYYYDFTLVLGLIGVSGCRVEGKVAKVGQ